VSSDYFRVIKTPTAPSIASIIAVKYDEIELSLVKPTTTDGPIAYYKVKNLTTDIISQFSPSLFTAIVISGLQARTSYSFSITAVSIDGISSAASLSQMVTTEAISEIHISPPDAPPPPISTPTVTSVTATSGSRLGGTSITITGTDFASGATVSIGGNPATSVTVVSSTSITAITPAHALGSTNIVVTNSDSGIGTGTGLYTFTGAVCNGSFTCVVGDTGPGGGQIFYVDSVTGFNCGPGNTSTGSSSGGLCHYLEAAPDSGSSSWAGGFYIWSGNTSVLIGTTSAAIGSGYSNTLAMIAQDSTTAKAGTISQAFRGPNNLSDWYLPSKDELNQLRLQRALIAGLVSDLYWSSTEDGFNYSWMQSSSNGGGRDYGKGSNFRVWPIRAFGVPSTPTIAGVSASSGSRRGGTSITITGTGFVSGAIVTIGGTAATGVTVVSPTSITVTTPLHSPGTVDVVVTNSDAGTATGTGLYTFNFVTCDGTFTCIVGDTGPGGGVIYFVDNVTGFSCGTTHTTTGSPTGGLCHYLEVAPSGWNTGIDPVISWAIPANYMTAVSGITADATANNSTAALGLGYANSLAILLQGNDTSTAAGVARAYGGGSRNDWYLPDTAELNVLCQWASGLVQDVATPCTGGPILFGGFASWLYWSSSTAAGHDNWAWYQYFSAGAQDMTNKYYDLASVRPIRAF